MLVVTLASWLALAPDTQLSTSTIVSADLTRYQQYTVSSVCFLMLQSRSNGRELLEKVLQECALTSSDKVHFSLATDEDSYLVRLEILSSDLLHA